MAEIIGATRPQIVKAFALWLEDARVNAWPKGDDDSEHSAEIFLAYLAKAKKREGAPVPSSGGEFPTK